VQQHDTAGATRAGDRTVAHNGPITYNGQGARRRPVEDAGIRLGISSIQTSQVHATGAFMRERTELGSSGLQFMLAEYQALREEILRRQDHRISLLISSLTLSTAVIGVGMERSSAVLLLLAPIVACLFGLLIQYHGMVIAEIGAYIRDDIERPIQSVYPDVSGWQLRRISRKQWFRQILVVGHLPVSLATVVPSVVGLIFAWSLPGPRFPKAALTVLGIVGLTYYLISYFLQALRRPDLLDNPSPRSSGDR
jgi:hypothetical protein